MDDCSSDDLHSIVYMCESPTYELKRLYLFSNGRAIAQYNDEDSNEEIKEQNIGKEKVDSLISILREEMSKTINSWAIDRDFSHHTINLIYDGKCIDYHWSGDEIFPGLADPVRQLQKLYKETMHKPYTGQKTH